MFEAQLKNVPGVIHNTFNWDCVYLWTLSASPFWATLTWPRRINASDGPAWWLRRSQICHGEKTLENPGNRLGPKKLSKSLSLQFSEGTKCFPSNTFVRLKTYSTGFEGCIDIPISEQILSSPRTTPGPYSLLLSNVRWLSQRCSVKKCCKKWCGSTSGWKTISASQLPCLKLSPKGWVVNK